MRTEDAHHPHGARTLWHPARWRRFRAQQPPGWPESVGLREIRAQLLARAPLVTPDQVHALRRQLTAVAEGRALMLQTGDCAETFALPERGAVAGTVALAREAARTVEERLGMPVVTVGRIAGQFAKPRSSPTEDVDGVRLPAFRGSLVNGLDADERSRRPEPRRLLWGYEHAARTLSLLRESGENGRPALWTSHEALVLDYEEPLTRWDAGLGGWVLCSTHFPWVGERTRHPDSAHVRFLAGVVNAVGAKVGPAAAPDEIVRLARVLDPERRPGRLVLIARMGADRVESVLPGLVEALGEEGHPASWICDPMHGNTVRARSGHKTRHMSAVLGEIRGFARAVLRSGGRPAGLHLEATAEAVTECVGGRCGTRESQVPERYLTACDPRLNADQTREAVECFAAELTREF